MNFNRLEYQAKIKAELLDEFHMKESARVERQLRDKGELIMNFPLPNTEVTQHDRA